MRTLLKALAGIALTAGLLAAQTLSNEDLIKLAKSGLSESFVLNMVKEQGENLSTDVSSLIDMKTQGVNQQIIDAAIQSSTQPTEPLNTDSVVRLVKAGFADDFILNLMTKRPGQFTANAARVIELSQAGVSERILSRMVNEGSKQELPSGTEIVVRLIDSIDSDMDQVGNTFRASLAEPLTLNGKVIADRGADATVELYDAEQSGRIRGRTSLTLRLVSVTMDGKPVTINSTDVAQSSGSRGARTAKSAAAVGALGAIIGGIAGGGKGAAIGAATGAGVGAGAQVFLDPQHVKVPSESVLTFLTDSPTTF